MTQTVIPQLRSTDARRSLAFYVDQLGFAIDWQHQFEPGLPLFFSLTREGQTIFLSEHAGDGEVGAAVYLVVPDVDACWRAFTARGAIVHQPPADMPWGAREFLIFDPDGNRLRFSTYASG